MADAAFNTVVADAVVPAVFTPYVQQLTEQKSRLIASGALARNTVLDGLLAGGGLTFSIPSWKDLDDDTENVSADQTADTYLHTLNSTSIDSTAVNDSRPKATGSATEIGVRLSRNQSWAAASLASRLAGSDIAASIADRVGTYWARRLQGAFVATINGISKDNGANDSGDYASDIVGGSFVNGVTNFSAEAVLDAMLTAGDSMEGLQMVMMHSVVYNRAQKNNLIDFIPDSQGVTNIPTFLGRQVIVDDGLPTGTGVVRADGSAGSGSMYETWLFGEGAVQMGVGTPEFATALQRNEQAGLGGGQTVLFSRVEWLIHPTGHSYIGTAPSGGPSNAASTNNLNIAGSWNRVYSERKQIKFARLITREA